MVLQHILAALWEMFSVRLIMPDGQVEGDPLHGLHPHQIRMFRISTCGDN
jgi:hypothetical protein